jgi:predicted nuclease with RNAse H fold
MRAIRLKKRQKIVGVIEDAKKPVIIQAPRVIPNKVSRTQLRKLEEEMLKKTEKMADIEFPFFRLDVQKGVAYVRGKDGKIVPRRVDEKTLKKFRRLMGQTKRNIGKDEREEFR